MRRTLLFVLCFIGILSDGVAQDNFQVTFGLDFSSAERLMELCDGSMRNVKSVAALRGNRIAALTSALIGRQQYDHPQFLKELELLRDNFSTQQDLYGFIRTRKYLPQIKAILEEVKKRQLDRKVLATLAAFFPGTERFAYTIPVYFVAFGNENASAFVRRVTWIDDQPYFVGDNEGSAVIVVNLSRLVQFNASPALQIMELQSTLAHEAFHAVLSEYQQHSLAWKQYLTSNNFSLRLAGLVQNEGIAYYISLQQDIGGNNPPLSWFNTTRDAITELNAVMAEFRSDSITVIRARSLLMNANLSGSFAKNYGATAGVRMAFEIDTKLGRRQLNETLTNGPLDFIEKYLTLCILHPLLPKIDNQVLLSLQQ